METTQKHTRKKLTQAIIATIATGAFLSNAVFADIAWALRPSATKEGHVSSGVESALSLQYDSLVPKSDFSYKSGNRRILYVDGVRYEFDTDGGLLRHYTIEDSDRDWPSELLELCVEFERLRLEQDAFIKRTKEGKSLGQRIMIQRTEDELAHKLNAFFHQLIEYRNQSPVIMRNIADQRDRTLKTVRALLDNLQEQKVVNIYVEHQVGGGAMGRARLIADALVGASPHIIVNIITTTSMSPGAEDYTFIDEGDSRINLIDMSLGVEQPTFSREVEAGDCGIKWIDFSDRFQDERLREAASVNIVVGGVPEFSERQDIFFNAIAMPYTQGYRRRYSVTYYRQRANNDLQDPYGTVYLDRGLLERRLTKNGWSLDDLMRNRRTWLRQNLINAQTEMLDHISRSEGWNPAKAIWTSGYVHKAEKFLAETDILCRAFSAEGIDEIPFIKEGRQLIIHLVDNKEWHSTRSTYHLADLIVDIAKRGITVINSDGENLTKTFRKKVPITVILHNNIKNKELKTLTSEMSGTAKRDANDEFWIDFPAFVTGSASWLETVSSGSIWLHDDVDTFPGLKEEILLSILIRMLALEDVNGEHSWQGLKAEAEARVGEFLMGTENNIDKYAHLEEWTLQARRYTEMMFRFNMVDDILAYIIETHKAEEGGKDSEAPASHKGPRKGYRYEREIQSAA